MGQHRRLIAILLALSLFPGIGSARQQPVREGLELRAKASSVATPDASTSSVPGSACAASWIPTFGGPAALNGEVFALEVWDDGGGAGPALYVGGDFTSANMNRVGKWDGTSWSTLGAGFFDGAVYDFAIFDDGSGSGPALYAAGTFTSPHLRVAKWTGSAWVPLGEGIGYDSSLWNDRVHALESFDDGSGPALYAGGKFDVAGGMSIRYLARWNGTSWSGVGPGPNVGPNNGVSALTVFEENGVERLFVGGWFPGAGGVPVNCIARWDGVAWSSVGGGVHPQDNVYELAVHDDGNGPALYVGGNISHAGPIDLTGIAKWDGAEWSALGTGLSFARALVSYDDGCGAGSALYVGGSFSTAGGVSALRLARWDGVDWSAVGGGMAGGSVAALDVFDDGSGGGPSLYVGGDFDQPVGSSDAWLAKWGHLEFPLGDPYCSGDGSGTPCPCGNAGGGGEGCANSSGFGALLFAGGSASVSDDDLVLSAIQLLPAQPVLLFSADNAVNGGAGIAFGDGLRCAGGNVRRLGVRAADGSGSAAWGPGLGAVESFETGATRRFQAWYRDPVGSPCGHGFNLSNGYAVLFIR